MALTVRIIALNYNGWPLLSQCLPSLLDSARRASYPTRVTVLDNRSQDESPALIPPNFPEVEVYVARQNKVLCSFNEYLPRIEEPVVILLNNDIRTDPGFVDPLVAPFKKDPDTFLVAPKVMNFSGDAIEAARTVARYRFGIYGCNARYRGHKKEADTPSVTDSSGFGAFDRKKFLELGGYDERYLPGIMEDVDLCYRAKERGYRLCYEPRSVVYHMGQASFKQAFGSNRTEVIAHRNTFLFMWKNLRGARFWVEQLAFVPLRILWSLLRLRTGLLRGFWEALRKARS